MNAELLLVYFNRFSDAYDFVPRLRDFILDLAVRGKLVEQQLAEGSGHELLANIKQLKAQMLRGMNFNREQKIELPSSDFRVTVPPSWVWAHIDDVAVVQGGKRLPSGATFSEKPTDHIYIRVTDMKNGTISTDALRYITPEVHEAIAKYTINQDDLYITIAGTIGQVGNVPAFFHGQNLTENAAKIVFRGLNAQYFSLALKSDIIQAQFKDKTKQMAQPKLALKRILGARFPLPPLSEQRRIVVMVDELMKLCDLLEAAQHEREIRRDHLTEALHHHLASGSGANEIRSNAQFFVRHLPRLTARPSQVKTIRRMIISLAVRGRLVAQDLDDGSASELLRRIRGESTANIGVDDRDIDFAQKCDAVPYQLPNQWAWTRFGCLITGADAGWSPKAEGFPREGDNWGVLKVSAVSWDKFDPSENKQLLPNITPAPATQVRAGDFLISRANTSQLVAKSVVVEQEPQKLILSDKIVRLQIAEGCNKHFLSMVNNHAEYARSYYAEQASGTSQSMKNVSRAVIYGLLIPLPPTAEQQRIVARVDQLMALCDRLEKQLAITQTEASRLLESVLYRALNDQLISENADMMLPA